MIYEDPSKTFAGVRFVLFGFDFSAEEKILSKLVDGGGINVGGYGPDSTHVIVDKLVYDDPICAAARSDGKTLVTGLWVDHSFDVGMPVDPASIMYRPLRDLHGIPGARSLVVCLTGYQRQDREDIMTMVGLMGANFSKPLVANKVTHLICYKFEGEKYELAKKMKKIKLVNHRWLEDCLKNWELLPEADYDKSGYELEMMEGQAKDSEDEAEAMAKKQRGEGCIAVTPQNSQFQIRSPKLEISRNISDITVSRGLPDVSKTDETVSGWANDVKPYPIQCKGTHNGCLEMPGSIDPGTAGKICSGASMNSFGTLSTPENVGNDSAFASKTDRKSPTSSASKFGSINHSREGPRRASLALDLGLTKTIAGSLPIEDTGELHVGNSFNICSAKLDNDGTIFNGVKASSNEILSHSENEQSGILPEKRKVATSHSSSKLQKTCPNTDFIAEGALVANETELPRPAFLTDGPMETTLHHSPGNDAHHLGLDSGAGNISSTATPEIGQEIIEEVPKMSFEKLCSIALDSKPPETIEALLSRPEDAVNNATEPLNGLEDGHMLCPGTKTVEVEKSNVTADSDFPMGGANSRSKPLKRKLLAKKTLGSMQCFGRGKALNQKGSIYMNNKVSQHNCTTSSIAGKEIEDLHRFVDFEKIKAVSPTSKAGLDRNVEMMNLSESGNERTNKSGFVDDETEAPEDNEENELDAKSYKQIPCDIHTLNLVNTNKRTDDSMVDMTDRLVNSSEDDTKNKAEIAASGKEVELGKSIFVDSAAEEKSVSAKNHHSKKATKKNHPQMTKVANSKEGEQRKVAKLKLNDKNVEAHNEESFLPVAGRDMKSTPEDIEKNSAEAEKENRPVPLGNQNAKHKKQQVGKVTPKFKKSLNADNPHSVSVGQILKQELAWFLLSGHRLQRKEFQQVIRHLKGRVCRDTHHWSYQATHFIVPDPIRRTEKFFAAAASGRWILKTDYLTASNEAGKFLDEEPYEWHKSGLSEDGAINMEAPRKWRLLRERTGHGAFYGMRVIIYGDCIVPPLDTLKRVVKTGDGTILATSPPYSRFLQSGVDFAIVSPGMPRVDIWVQEFLRYEIPCVSADYLVEYVCKPGYSLDKHVQYNTHAWTEKSYRKLINSMNEVIEDFSLQEDQGLNDDDIPCIICGSRDRGEVMLICGDEGGSLGCGIGTHIGCCDPPLGEIPEEDWFCSKCTGNKKSKSTRQNFRKPTSTSKQKK